ncbi:MAG TPA: hypothetical protein VGE17_06225 [Methylophilus sp.]
MNKKTVAVAAVIAFFMLLTRGSHMLTPFSLPDASVMLFLMGGLLLRRALWFALFFTLAATIDFGTAALDPTQGFCLTGGYWGMVPAYGVMWLGGTWLADQIQPLAALRFAITSLFTSSLAFVISTQTYYLFSGRFPQEGIWSALHHGWEYLPAWLGYTGLYIAIILLARQAAVWLKLPMLDIRNLG